MSKLLRKSNLEQAEHDIATIEDEGHLVERFTAFHWRVDDLIDVWPSSKKFMVRDGNFRVRIYNQMKEIFN